MRLRESKDANFAGAGVLDLVLVHKVSSRDTLGHTRSLRMNGSLSR